MIRIGVVGAGLIGKERIRASEILAREGRSIVLAAILDPYAADVAELAKSVGAVSSADLQALIAQQLDWVVVATPHDSAAELLPQLLAAGLQVLVEKPLGRSAAEAMRIAAAAPAADRIWVGQNYRFFAGVAALLRDARDGWFGEPIGLSLRLGHGGAPNDAGSWKLDPGRAGGGVLIDPGIHLLDLINCFDAGPLEIMSGTSWSGFWKSDIEEEVRLLLRGTTIPMIDATVSIVRWRSLFRVELHGVDGYGVVEGRGRSYGVQRYWRGRRWGWLNGGSQADSEEVIVETDCSNVFADEMRTLLFGVADPWGVQPCSLTESLRNMALLEACRGALALPSIA